MAKRMTEISKKWSSTGINLDAAENEARRLEKKGTFAATMDEEAGTVTLSKDDFKSVMGKLGSHKRTAKTAKKNVLLLAFGYLAVTIGFIAVIVGLVNWRLEATKESHVVGSNMIGNDNQVVRTGDVESYAQLFDLPHFDMATINKLKDVIVELEDGRKFAFSITRAEKSVGSTRLQLEDSNGNGLDIDSCATLALAKIDGKYFAVAGMGGSRKLASVTTPKLYSTEQYALFSEEQRVLGVGSSDIGTAIFALDHAKSVLDNAAGIQQPRDWTRAYIESETMVYGGSMVLGLTTAKVIADRTDGETNYIVGANNGVWYVWIDTMLAEIRHEKNDGTHSACLPYVDYGSEKLSNDLAIETPENRDCNEDGYIRVDINENGIRTLTRTTLVDFTTADQRRIRAPNFILCIAHTWKHYNEENVVRNITHYHGNRDRSDGLECPINTPEECDTPIGFQEAAANGRNLEEDMDRMDREVSMDDSRHLRHLAKGRKPKVRSRPAPKFSAWGGYQNSINDTGDDDGNDDSGGGSDQTSVCDGQCDWGGYNFPGDPTVPTAEGWNNIFDDTYYSWGNHGQNFNTWNRKWLGHVVACLHGANLPESCGGEGEGIEGYLDGTMWSAWAVCETWNSRGGYAYAYPVLVAMFAGTGGSDPNDPWYSTLFNMLLDGVMASLGSLFPFFFGLSEWSYETNGGYFPKLHHGGTILYIILISTCLQTLYDHIVSVGSNVSYNVGHSLGGAAITIWSSFRPPHYYTLTFGAYPSCFDPDIVAELFGFDNWNFFPEDYGDWNSDALEWIDQLLGEAVADVLFWDCGNIGGYRNAGIWDSISGGGAITQYIWHKFKHDLTVVYKVKYNCGVAGNSFSVFALLLFVEGVLFNAVIAIGNTVIALAEFLCDAVIEFLTFGQVDCEIPDIDYINPFEYCVPTIHHQGSSLQFSGGGLWGGAEEENVIQDIINFLLQFMPYNVGVQLPQYVSGEDYPVTVTILDATIDVFQFIFMHPYKWYAKAAGNEPTPDGPSGGGGAGGNPTPPGGGAGSGGPIIKCRNSHWDAGSDQGGRLLDGSEGPNGTGCGRRFGSANEDNYF